ncbi:MAG: DNA topoisomerase I [Nanoarchaeota archaeon]|nr:DNA topoisomerase I [Nanoarchaeota archaeon]MBU1975603.1 DNA topoisomerase I [Nanoarchaeota archaeon]
MSKYELIITEKPNAALKIAAALADGKPIKESITKVPYYKITHGKRDIVVACAVGHLYTLAEKEKSFKYPSYDIEWRPSADVTKSSAFSKKYLNVIKKLAKGADEFTVACDYDTEGEVIGLNIIKYACKQKDARRMKFSTLLKDDLVRAYENPQKTLDWGQANAGETRHRLDWLYGINLSRALTISLKKAGMFKILSIGRVQGPALKIVVDKEIEIREFKPVPFWQLLLTTEKDKKKIESLHKEDKIWDQKKAKDIFKKCKGKPAFVSEVDASQFKQKPPTPFDLGTLQTESFRLFGISPKDTLAIAQTLYTDGLTSYPRTSSQQYPKDLDFKKILTSLQKLAEYKSQTSYILGKKTLKPNQGQKTDPAHPAIYPTGSLPKKLEGRDMKIFDLIVKRFFAVFGEPATRETITLTIEVEKEPFITKGTRTIEKGWHDLYAPYVKLKEEELPKVAKGEELKILDLELLDKETQPPKRYTQASIIGELEKHGLGTKATRAEIVDNLVKRGYILDKPVEATELGIKTIKIMEKHLPEIVDEQLTRSFEDEMDKIREDKLKPKNVVDHAESALNKILETFKKDEKKIGEALLESHKESSDQQNTIGACQKCDGGTLKVMYSRKIKKRFIACDKYPDCKTIYPLPQKGIVKSTEKICETCKHPMIHLAAGKRSQTLCINPDCPTKQTESDEAMKKEADGKKCPKCGKGLVVKTSMYGKFLACPGFPKCKHTEKLQNGNNNNSKKK